MAEGSVSLIKPLEQLRRLENLPFSEGSVILCLLSRASELTEVGNLQIYVRMLNSVGREVHKRVVSVLERLVSLLSLSKYVEIQKRAVLLFERWLFSLELIEIHYNKISVKVSGQLSWLSRCRLRSLSSLSSLKFSGEISWPEPRRFRSLHSLYEDFVKNGRIIDGVSPFRGEEDNHVSSGNNEGRLDDHSGSNDVSGRLISVSDGGGIEELRVGETPGPSTEISHGTDGLESFIQSVMVPFLWQVVDEWGKCGNWQIMLKKVDLENVLMNTPSYSDRLKEITNNVRSEFPRLLQLQKRNPSLSLEDLKVYCVLLCWSSKKRVDFWSDLSDQLLWRADELKKLRLELERTWQLHFGERRNDKIDEKWINESGEKWRPYFGEKWIEIIDEEWIENFGKKWIDEKIEIEEWIKNFGKKWIDEKIEIEEWIKNVDRKYKPRGSDFIFVRGLLRFMRNRRHHSDKFQESQKLRSVESFYNYFDTLFPCLLMVSYRFSYRFCREETWFEKYR